MYLLIQVGSSNGVLKFNCQWSEIGNGWCLLGGCPIEVSLLFRVISKLATIFFDIYSWRSCVIPSNCIKITPNKESSTCSYIWIGHLMFNATFSSWLLCFQVGCIPFKVHDVSWCCIFSKKRVPWWADSEVQLIYWILAPILSTISILILMYVQFHFNLSTLWNYKVLHGPSESKRRIQWNRIQFLALPLNQVRMLWSMQSKGYVRFDRNSERCDKSSTEENAVLVGIK